MDITSGPAIAWDPRNCPPRHRPRCDKMDKMDAWNLAILLVAAYVAVITLARLMIRRRNEMLEQFRHEVENEKRRRKAEPPAQQPPRERAA